MSKYIINGGKPLTGEISIRGAKNASFKQIIASMLSSKTTYLSNIPQISDVNITESIAQYLGSKIVKNGPHSIEITTENLTSSTVPHGTGEKSRSSFMFIAPLLLRTGKAVIPSPGGDKLGTRPLDRLLDCYDKMGITTEITNDIMTFTASKIKPVHYVFPKQSHTVTEVLIMTATLLDGQTILDNSALEPEIDDLIVMLNSMGAKIIRDLSDPKRIVIDGVPWLSGTTHQVISDRNETVTFACAALATKGSINILRCDPKIIKSFLDIIETMGAKVFCGKDEVSISWTQPLKAIDIVTSTEPGFMTDWQAIFSLVLSQSVGVSSVIERIFPNRFQHIPNLNSMGAKTTYFNPNISDPENYYDFNPDSDKTEYFHGIKIYGPTKLKPNNFIIKDLRAGATATLAALTASGESVIDGVEFIERGYEKLADRLKSLGADIKYIKT